MLPKYEALSGEPVASMASYASLRLREHIHIRCQ